MPTRPSAWLLAALLSWAASFPAHASTDVEALLVQADAKRSTDPAAFRGLLARDYPPAHEVILYEAATTALGAPRMQRLPLAQVAAADVDLRTTLVVPPCRPLRANADVVAELERLDALSSAA